MRISTWRIKEMTGYEPQTTFYEDFSIADMFGAKAVIDTYKRAFKGWKDNVVYVTELCMALNWKSWEHQNDKLCETYCDLFYTLQDWCYENLKDEDLNYFIRTTD